MKSLQKFVSTCLGEDFKIVPITFKHGATGLKDKRKGYSIVGPSSNPFSSNRHEYFIFEPCNYSNGDKWLISGWYFRRYATISYAKNMQQAIKTVKKVCSY